MKKGKLLALALALLMAFSPAMALAESVYTVTWNSNPNPATWTGNHWSGTPGGWVWDLGTEGLFQFSRLTDSVTPRLASSISHADNITTVKMVENGKYSDGNPITAKDIWGYYQLHRDRVTFYLKEIRIVDDYTLEFEFREPAPFEQMREWLIANSGRQSGCPYHLYGEWIDKAAEIWAKAPDNTSGTMTAYGKDITGEELAAEWAANWAAMTKFVPEGKIMVSSGPYIQEILTESELILKKNPNYRAADQVKFDKFVSKITTPEQGIAMLKNAETDCYPGSLPIDVALDVLASNTNIVFYPTVDPACHGLYFNQQSKNAPLNDKVLRKAIAYLLDKEPAREIGNYYGTTTRYSCLGLPPAFLEKYVPKEVIDQMEVYNYDPAKAEQLLLDAGYKKDGGKWADPTGKPIVIKIGVNGAWQPAAVVGNVNTIVAEQLKEFGFDAEVLVTETTIFPEKVKSGEFDMVFEWIDVAWSFAYPMFPLADMYDSEATLYRMQIPSNPKTGKPQFEGLTDYEGKPIDPVELLLKMPTMTEEERMDACARLVWLANENCFGINLYQNVTGIWENRAHTQGLPYADKIDENKQFMLVPEMDDPEMEHIANLNWGFSGYNKLFFLEPTEANK